MPRKRTTAMDTAKLMLDATLKGQRERAELSPEQFIETVWDISDGFEENAQTGEVTMDAEQFDRLTQAFWDLGGRYRSKLKNLGWSPSLRNVKAFNRTYDENARRRGQYEK